MIFNLKKEWFEKIKNGEKTHEYREVKPFWTNRLMKEDVLYLMKHGKLRAEFVCGYPPRNDTSKRIQAVIKDITIVDGLKTDLQVDADVYDIAFEVV